MRKTGTVVSCLVCGILASACSDSSSHKDATAFGDGGASEVGELEVGGGGVTGADSGIGTTAGPEVGVQAATLTIASGMRFATPSLTVPAGTIIAVQNQDSLPHTVTSSAAPNDFTPSGAFDTGVIDPGGSASITIPADAVSGTVFYFYCNIHRAAMVPPTGMIIVQ